MRESYEQMLSALRDRTVYVYVDVQPPRDAPVKQFVAYLFGPAPGESRPTRPNGQSSMLEVTPDQARELLAAGAEWKGPSHLLAQALP